MDDTEIMRLGRLAVELGYCTFNDVKGAALQHAANPGSRFTDVLVERRAVTPEQVDVLLLLQAGVEEGRDAVLVGCGG